MKRVKYIIALHINEDGGRISIREVFADEHVMFLHPNEIGTHHIDEFQINVDDAIEHYCLFVRDYGTFKQFYEFQPNFKNYLGRLRLVSQK